MERRGRARGALALGALGVVFGDIGTSPLYALQAVFTADHGAVHATPGEVYGVVSLVFWSITVIVSVKYVGFVMRADNAGRAGSGADCAPSRGPVSEAPGEADADHPWHPRRLSVLRGRDDHPSDLGVVRGRGS